MENTFFEEQLFHSLIQRLQPQFRSGDEPVRHCLSRQLNALLLQFLFLAVERRVHHKLLRHQMRDRLSRSKAAFDDRIRLRCFDHRSIRFILMTLFACVGKVYVLTDSYLCRDHLQMFGDLLADDFHLFTAIGTSAFFFTELMLDGVGLDVLGELVKAAGLLLTLILFYRDLCVSILGILQRFRFIEEQSHLLIELFRAL